MVDINIPFTTNAAAAAADIAALKRETAATADVAQKFKQRALESAKATDVQVAAIKRQIAADKELNAEIGRLMQRQGQLGRRTGEFRSNNGGGPGGGGGGGIGAGRFAGGGEGRGLGKMLNIAGRVSGIPGLGAVGGIASAAASLGSAGALVLGAAAALGPAALIFKMAAVKAEIAADSMKGAALGLKASDSAYRAGTAAKESGARGGFEANGDDLLKLISRGGSYGEAKGLMQSGIGDAVGGLSIAQLIDPKDRAGAVAAARKAASLGEGSFGGFLEMVRSGQVSVSGNAAADAGSMIGAGRGTVALSEGQVGWMEQNRSSNGGDIGSMRASRGRAQAAKMGAGIDGAAVGSSYYDEADAASNPTAGPTEAARASLEEAIRGLEDAASAQGAVAAQFANFLAKWGMSAGSDSVRARRTAGAARQAAGF